MGFGVGGLVGYGRSDSQGVMKLEYNEGGLYQAIFYTSYF